MTTYKSIPLATDQRNVSQNDILTNFQYLQTPTNPLPGVPSGVIDVDHVSSGITNSPSTNGFHAQVSFMDRLTPANLINPTNNGTSSGIEYSKTDGAGNSQLRYLNSAIDSPLTYLKAMVMFDDTGAIIGNKFNVSTVVKNGSGNFTITMPVAMPNTFYLVILGFHSNNVTRVFLGNTVIKNNGDFTVQEFQLVSGVPLATGSADLTNVFVYGLF